MSEFTSLFVITVFADYRLEALPVLLKVVILGLLILILSQSWKNHSTLYGFDDEV
jgi:hypothetical protein